MDSLNNEKDETIYVLFFDYLFVYYIRQIFYSIEIGVRVIIILIKY